MPGLRRVELVEDCRQLAVGVIGLFQIGQRHPGLRVGLACAYAFKTFLFVYVASFIELRITRPTNRVKHPTSLPVTSSNSHSALRRDPDHSLTL